MHKPVLAKEAIQYLNLHNGDIIVDATLGCAGHTLLILEKIQPDGLLIGIDRDIEALNKARERLNTFENSLYKIVKGDFRYIDEILAGIGIKKIDGIIFDLGTSTLQFESPHRGFSIKSDGPLDMRMDLEQKTSAFDAVNRYPEEKLRDIIKRFGEERYAGRIAQAIVKNRKQPGIKTTSQLAAIITQAVGSRYKRQKIHPATRTFQAIRIEVNKELEALNEALQKLPGILNKGARICVISFHSLEDRIVKNFFRTLAKENKFLLVNKKPITPNDEEIKSNPRSRSAKLRVAEFI